MMIRNATLDDVLDLARLTKVLGYPVADMTEFAARLEKLLFLLGHRLLVAEVDGTVHGFVEAEIHSTLCVREAFVIVGLVVDVDYQDNGLGGQLLEALETDVQKSGVRQISLNSGESRHLAHEFYEKHGYVLDHMQKKFVKTF
jgi:GNAT superfamily N-acetyltransferase